MTTPLTRRHAISRFLHLIVRAWPNLVSRSISCVAAVPKGRYSNREPRPLATAAKRRFEPRRRQFWPHAAVFILAALLAQSSASAQAPAVHWKCTTADHPWADQPDLAQAGTAASPVGQEIFVYPDDRSQTIDGWGGCFNERGWRALQVLTDTERTAVMRRMFDPADGLKLNICRTPIAASDYAIDLYSYDETPGDFDMSHFSIDRDQQMLIPYIKAALALQPHLKLWAVPWSPPSWMKDSGKLTGGHIKTDPATMDALALYFAKYIQAYRAQGLPLFMVMPQNEPCYSTGYTSCEWTGAEMGVFVRDYLGPMFKKLNLDCQIYLGTFPRSDPKKYDYDYWLAPSMTDPLTRLYVTGVGCQWDGASVMRNARDKNPGIKLMQTEAECGDKNTNDWDFADQRFKQVVQYLDCGAQSFMIWNLVLDETGQSTANWAQCSPIVVNQTTRQVIFTPYFYAFEHFSSFVTPGSVRLAVASAGASCEAFVNPDGKIVLVLENAAETAAPVTLNFGARNYPRSYLASLPAKSFNTFVMDHGSAQPATPTR